MFGKNAVPKKVDWDRIEAAYLRSGESMAAIALQFGVSKRAVEIRASEGGWYEKREALEANRPRNVPLMPPAKGIDELNIVDTALLSISAAMADSETDARSLGSCASGLCRLIELRLKLRPRTAADLAEQAISLGISPEEFMKALGDSWQLRA